jgi:hypothetical protein
VKYGKKTHTCGELTKKDVGRAVTLMGWVHTRRDHGGLIFVDLRDRTGITQVVFNPEVSSDAHALAQDIRSEFVLAVTGKVSVVSKARPFSTRMPSVAKYVGQTTVPRTLRSSPGSSADPGGTTEASSPVIASAIGSADPIAAASTPGSAVRRSSTRCTYWSRWAPSGYSSYTHVVNESTWSER